MALTMSQASKPDLDLGSNGLAALPQLNPALNTISLGSMAVKHLSVPVISPDAYPQKDPKTPSQNGARKDETTDIKERSPPHSTTVEAKTMDFPTSTLPDCTTQITKSWDIPPRPKPGRKPAADVPPTKRKAQNRDSQRKFRQKKVEEVVEIREKLLIKETEMKQREMDWDMARHKHEEEMRQWRRHAEYWEHLANTNQAAISELEIRLRSIQNQMAAMQGTTDGPHQVPNSTIPAMPPSGRSTSYKHDRDGNIKINSTTLDKTGEQHANEDMEIDFTTYSKPQSRMVEDIKAQDLSVPSMALDNSVEDSCGFCDKGTLCFCSEMAKATEALPTIGNDLAAEVPNTVERAQIMEPPTTATGPGTCDACMRDPERKRFCESLATQVKLPPLQQNTPSNQIASSTTQPSTANTLAQTHDNSDIRITCADTYERLKQFPSFRENSTRIMRELRPRPAVGNEPSGMLQGTGRAPFAVDAASLDAACMLAAMSSGGRM